MTHPANSNSVFHSASSESSASGQLTPDQIRLTIQRFIADSDVDTASSLAQEGLVAYPDNEGVLAISSLVACVRGEWDRAVDLLTRLIAIQGDRASEFTKMMFERAKACSGAALPPQRQESATVSYTGN